MLYQEQDSGDKKLVVPESPKEVAVQLNHDLKSADHQGIVRTKGTVKKRSSHGTEW